MDYVPELCQIYIANRASIPMKGRERHELISLAVRFEDPSRPTARRRMSAEDLHQLINYYDQNHQLERAFDVIDYALERGDRPVDLHLRRAELYLNMRQEAHALDALDRAEELDADSLRIALLRAKSFAKLDLFDDALALLEELKTTATAVEKSDIYYYQAFVYECRGRAYSDEAFTCLQHAILFNENNQAAYEAFFSLRYLKRWSECLGLFKRKTEENAFHAPSWYALGEIYADEALRRRAIESFEYAYLSDPDYLRAYLRAAEEWRNIGRPEEALKCYADVEKRIRRNPEALCEVGCCYLQLQRYAPALELLRAAFRLEQKLGEVSGELLWLIGRCYRGLNRPKQAVRYFVHALQYDEMNDAYHLDLARAYADQNKVKSALRHYARAVEYMPDENESWFEYILFLQANHRLDAALAMLEEGNLGVYNPEFDYIEVILWYREGQIDRALYLLREALDSDFDAHEILGRWGIELLNDKRVMALIHTKPSL